jgi:hypothetical protein
MKSNELLRRLLRAADLAADVAGVPLATTDDDRLLLLEQLLRNKGLVAARHGCPHDIRHIAWDQSVGDWRCICGQAMNLDGSTK